MSRVKPVVAVASATRPPGLAGDLPGPDAHAVTALFARSGVIRVDTVAELFDVGLLLAHQPLPAGRRVAVVGNSSALSGLAVGRLPGERADRRRRLSARHQPAGRRARVRRRAGRRRRSTTAVDALVVVFAPPLPGQLPDEDADFAAALGERRAGRREADGRDVPARASRRRGCRPTRRSRRRSGRWAGWRLRGLAARAARRAARAADVARRGRRRTAPPAGPARRVRHRRWCRRRPRRLAGRGPGRGGRTLGLPGGAEGGRAAPCGTGSTWARSGSPWPTRTTSGPRTPSCWPRSARDVLVQSMVAAGRGLHGRGGRGSGVRPGGRLRPGRRGQRAARRPGLARRAADRPGRRARWSTSRGRRRCCTATGAPRRSTATP